MAMANQTQRITLLDFLNEGKTHCEEVSLMTKTPNRRWKYIRERK